MIIPSKTNIHITVIPIGMLVKTAAWKKTPHSILTTAREIVLHVEHYYLPRV